MAINLRDTKTQIIILIVVLALGCIYAFYSWVYNPNVKKIENLKAERTKIESELEQARAAVKRLPEIQRRYVILMKKWEQALILLPSAKEIENLLRQIQSMGYNSDVRFIFFKPSTAPGDSLYSKIPVSLSLTGDYHSLTTFLTAIANLPRIVTSSDLKVVPNPDAKERDRGRSIKAELTATTYIYIGGSPSGAAIDISTWQISPPITDEEVRLERESYTYDSQKRRDPLVPLVTKTGYRAEAGALNTEDLVLIGTMWGTSGRVAMVKDSGNRGYVLKPGDRVAGGKVIDVREDAIVFEISAFKTISKVTLKLIPQNPEYTGPAGGVGSGTYVPPPPPLPTGETESPGGSY